MAEGGGGDFSNDCICACIYAMRRFMEMVKMSQNICHDTGCIDDYPSLDQSSYSNGYLYVVLLLFVWVIVAMLLYTFRPPSLRPSPQK